MSPEQFYADEARTIVRLLVPMHPADRMQVIANIGPIPLRLAVSDRLARLERIRCAT